MKRLRFGWFWAGLAATTVFVAVSGYRALMSASAPSEMSGIAPTVSQNGAPAIPIVHSDNEPAPRANTSTSADNNVFSQFGNWFDRYQAADLEERIALEAEGVALAASRRATLKNLIESDPEAALKHATPHEVRREAPPAIAAQFEERVSGRGELAVLAALAEPGREAEVTPVFRTAEINGRSYNAFVYGRRLGEPTRRNIALNGIALDGQLAVDVDPVRVLEGAEAADALVRLAAAQANEAVCGVSGDPAASRNEPTPVEVVGHTYYLCGTNHIKPFNEKWVAAEGGGPAGGEGEPEIAASAWTEGTKRLLVIRVDFSDLSLSLTDSGASSMISGLDAFYTEMSYGRTGFSPAGSGSAYTPILRMPNTAASYGSANNYTQLRADARAAATRAGFNLANYDFDVICMGAVPGFGWAGLAYVGGAGAWLRNNFSVGVAGHEIGHNYGLNHANAWDTAGQSVIGPGGSSEYGDIFDTMGSANGGANHFNARYKAYLNWLRTTEVLRVTASSTNRIYAHDSPAATGLRGLYVAQNSQTNYWIEFRQKFTGNKWMMNGAGLRTAMSGNQRSQLLDLTPGSADGKNDSPLVIGRTYSDFAAGVHITPLRKGGTTPESLDVVVNVGSFSGNSAPTLTVGAPLTSAAPGVTLNFSASASDANGDVLSYFWDFGDGNFGNNSSTASTSWSAAGEYVVRCVVTDMKGGTASDSVIVRIGSPTTYRISGVVLNGTAPLAGARVSVSSTRMTYTDSDGAYNLVNLPAGTYTVNASLYPLTLAATFANPVTVGPDRAGINFNTGTVSPPSIVSQPASQTVNIGASVTFTVSASGTAPLTYQWRFNGANIAGATGASYTKANVQSGDAGNYSVVVANPGGSVTSANAALTINAPPAIVSQPQSQSVIAGASVSFNVQASGSSLSYQWRLNGTNLPGATSATYSIANTQPSHVGSYLVVIANALGGTTSAVATLSVRYALAVSATGGTVAKSPDASSYAPGTTVTLTATSTSSFPFSGWSGDASGTSNPLTVTMNANKTIVANFASPVPDLIVDNSAASFTGTWAMSTSSSDKYGADSRLVAGASSTPTATATFRPNVVTAGRYHLYMWSPTVSRPAAAVPILIVGLGGTLSMTINQATGAGTWRLLASDFLFRAGTNDYIRIANDVNQSNTDVAADAVRLVYSTNQISSAPIITSQPANVVFTAGSTLQFNVIATGTGPLTYQWRFNGANIANATSPSLSINGAGAGNAGGYAVVVANASGAVTSQVAIASMAIDLPPTVTLTSPVNGTILRAPATFSGNATASDDGAVARVEFYLGEVLLNDDTTSPYTFTMVGLNAGNYVVSAVAVDNSGARATNSVNLTVNAAPAVALTAPVNGAAFGSPATFTLTANATDSDGSVAKVEFFEGTSKLGETVNSPYSLPVNNVPTGSYVLTVRATDNLGTVSTSSVVNITVGNNTPPTVAITSPANGASYVAPASVTINAVAADIDGTVTQVEFYNGAGLVGLDTASPYTASANNLAAGTHTLRAVAVDNFGARVTNSVAIIVVNNLAPTVAITSPSNGSTFSQPASFTVQANAADSDGTVVRVEFYSGVTLLVSDTASPYSASVSSLPAGNYTLQAVAVDNSGARATNAIAIAVKKGRGGAVAGLYYETDQVTAESAGSFNLTTTDAGSFSGYVLSGGLRAPFRGQLDTNNQATLQVLRKNSTPLEIHLSITHSNGVNYAAGTVTDGTWEAHLAGSGAAYHAATNPVAAAGNYTFLLPGSENLAGPKGYGFGSVKITTAGRIVFRGVLNDGQRVAQSVALSADGQWPLYLPLHKGAGLAIGWITVADRENDDFSGAVEQIRPPNLTQSYYSTGFAHQSELIGSRYTAPADSTAPVIDLPSGAITWEGGNWHSRATNRVSLARGNKLIDAGDQSVKGAVNAKSGLITGKTLDESGRPTVWRGAVLQKAHYGAGQAVGTNGTACVLLTP